MAAQKTEEECATEGDEETPSADRLVQRWSTLNVQPSNRLDYFASALSEAVIPFSIDDADPASFESELSVARLDTIEICKTIGSPHRSFRGSNELSLSTRHKINLLMVLNCPWTARHRNAMQLAPGDILLHDSYYPIDIAVRHVFRAINIALNEDWLRRWVPNPGMFVGRPISGKSMWGRALSSYLAELSPEFLVAPPLPLSILSDQVGSLLALAASSSRNSTSEYTPAIRSLHERICDVIQQRCTESQLTAADVATSLNISLRTLHRTFAAAHETFGARLMNGRLGVALRMLSSPLFGRVTTAEIGRRAGFVSASHFARVVRKRTGYTPAQVRRTHV